MRIAFSGLHCGNPVNGGGTADAEIKMGKTYLKKKSWCGEMYNKRGFGYSTLSNFV